jgi:hypothetical protein
MKLQVCYSQDKRVIQALRLFKSTVDPKVPNSSFVDTALVGFMERNLQQIKSEHVRSEVADLIEAFRSAAG